MSTAAGLRCPVCATQNLASNRYCGGCGAEIPEKVFCSKCGQQMSSAQSFCGSCGSATQAAPSQSVPNAYGVPPVSATPLVNLSGLSFYYQQEFRQIAETGEGYKGKFNWAAFFFGIFWALSKGLWLPSLIAFIGSIFTGGIAGVVYWFVFAFRGNYLYYAKHAKGKDLPI